MDLRPHEKYLDLDEKGTRACAVCKERIWGPARVIVSRANPYVARHVDCVPKSEYKSPEESKPKPLEPESGQKRRRAGGHGYTGGDGWTEI
jgi:hypothetical protein